MAHAKLSPSGATRWLNCPGSIRLCEAAGNPNTETAAAMEGTLAHEVAEATARREILGERVENPPAADQMMIETGERWASLLRERMGNLVGPLVFLEQRVNPGVPSCYGTADAIILSDGVVDVIDLKYGTLLVDPTENPQLMLYGLGALALAEMFYDIREVRLTIFQPRVGDGAPRTWTTTPEALRQWRQDVRAVAEVALNDEDSPIQPSEEACRFCPVAGRCRARKEYETNQSFGEPGLLTPTELAAAMNRVASLRRWCDAVSDEVRVALGAGSVVPGWGLRKRAGRRKIVNAEALLAKLRELGYDPAPALSPTTVTVSELQKLLGERFEEVASPYLDRGTQSVRLEKQKDKIHEEFD